MSQRLAIAALIYVFVSTSDASAQIRVAAPPPAHATHLGKSPVEVPMDFWGPRPIIRARINGKGPFRFIVDTGTTSSAVLDESLLQELGIAPKDVPADPADLAERPAGKIDTIAVGDAEFRDVQFRPMKLKALMPSDKDAPDGILGVPLFKDCLLTFDYPNRKFVLSEGELAPAENVLPYSPDEQRDMGLTIQVTVADQPLKVHIDTGSPSLLTLLNKWIEKLPLEGAPQSAGVARTPAGPAEVKAGKLRGDLKIGPHIFKNPEVKFADLGPMVDHDCGNVGSDLLKDFAMTIDQKNRRVRLERAPTVEQAGDANVRKSTTPCRVGVAFRFENEDWIVNQVFPGGAGEIAGLKAEDRLISINGKPMSELDRAKVGEIFGSPNPAVVKIKRGEEVLEITITPQKAE